MHLGLCLESEREVSQRVGRVVGVLENVLLHKLRCPSPTSPLLIFCDNLQCFSHDEIHFPFSGDLERLVRSSNLYINLSKRERAIPFLPLKLEKAESWKIQNELLRQ